MEPFCLEAIINWDPTRELGNIYFYFFLGGGILKGEAEQFHKVKNTIVV